MKAQRQRQHAGPKAHMVVDAVSRTRVVVLSWHVRRDPHPKVSDGIEVPRLRIG